jgi:uncharacterized protein YxjI
MKRVTVITSLPLLLWFESSQAFVPPKPASSTLKQKISAIPFPSWSSLSSSRLYNLLDDIGDMIGMGGSSTLVAQSSLPYDQPFCKDLSCDYDQVRTFAVQERLWSFTGEDFDIYNAFSGAPFVRVRGAMLHLPGKDKLRMVDANDRRRQLLELDRKVIAATPTYDIYRTTGDGRKEKVGWIEKKFISMTDTFDVYMEGKGGFGVTGLFKPPPAYRITGDFLDRNFVMRNEENQVVARVSEDWVVEFDAFNHYQVQVAPGMDALLVLACLCVIDEEFDEEHKAKKKEREG